LQAPNLLFIVADQLRARSLGCYGDAQARTPVLDRLAQRGTRFRAAYSTYPVCTPARASIQTGLMPTSCHVVWNNQTLEPVYPCLAEALSQAGYDTAYVGKWHLGGYGGPPGQDYRVPIKSTHRHGWNDLFLITHGEDYRPGRTPTLVGEQSALRFDEWQPTWQTNEAIKYLRGHDAKRPWVLNLNYALPHTPYLMPEKYRSLFDPAKLVLPPNVPKPDAFREELALYNSLTAWLDDEVSRVLAALDEMEGGRDTVIVFTADHGWNLGSHGLPAKFSLYEESACVPLIIAGPDVPQSSVCEQPVSLIDLMPTLLDFAGAELPEGVQGESLRPLMSGGAWTRRSIYLQVIDHPQHNLERWDPPSRGVRSDRYKYIERVGGQELLFDLQSDPYELHDLSARGEYSAVIEEHRRKLREWAARADDPWPAPAMEGLYYSIADNPFGEFQALGRRDGSYECPVYDAGRRGAAR
jgi:arylsulfatase A-like enzyme